MKVRRVAAIALLALFALHSLPPPRHPWDRSGPPWVPQLQAGFVIAVVLTAALGLARSWRWARMLSVSVALAMLLAELISAMTFLWVPELVQRTAWSAALVACLAGSAFLAHYEGQRGAVDWRAPGMRALWWAIVLNGMTLILLPVRLIGAWEHWWDCWSSHYPAINHSSVAYWSAIVLAPLLLVGLGLLARQKTAGLLLTAVMSVAFPLALVASLRGTYDSSEVRQVLLIPVPGLVAAWVAVAFWAKRMWTLLRG